MASRHGLTRRDFLKMTGTGLAGASLLGAAGCSGGGTTGVSAGDGMWKQYAGTTLSFVSENTAPTSAIGANLGEFEKLTGIKINILQLELTSLVQKVALDIGSGLGSYQILYADPYQILAPYHGALADLNEFDADGNLPSIERGVEDFIPAQLTAAGRFGDEKTLYGLPYDCPTMIWMYRKDLFEKHGDQMSQDLGFDPMPSESSTWDQYFQIAQWFNDNADEVPYGTGHQAKQHDSLMNDFSNVLWAYGGDYFDNPDVGSLGASDPGPSILDDSKSIEGAEFYKKLLEIAHPSSTSWDWNALDEAFRAGQVAMAPNWHEFAAGIVDSSIGDKVGFAPLPKGPARKSGMWGGTGLAVNGASPVEEQRAAWLFLVWATSPETQLMGLKSDVGGGTPTRSSLYERPDVKKAMEPPSDMPNMLTYDAVSTSWESDNIGLRPKIPAWNECDTIIFTELSSMLVSGKSPEEAMKTAKTGFDEANTRVQNLASTERGGMA